MHTIPFYSLKEKYSSNLIFLFLAVSVLIISGCNFSKGENSEKQSAKEDSKWVGTWSTAPQLVEPRNMPPDPGLSNNTLRQVVRISLGGDSLKLHFSNEFSPNPIVLNQVEIAISKGADSIDTTTIKQLQFDGKAKVSINPQEAVTSDPLAFNIENRGDLAITIYYDKVPEELTGHPGSRTTSFIAEGNKISARNLSEAVKTEHWYTISGIDVKAPESAGAVAIIGNSITDGRGSGTNKQNRWPDILSERLLKNEATKNVSVLNQGIGGNAVLRGGLGPTALKRFDRDILNQNGVKWLIIMEGVNDLGGTKDSTAAFNVAENLISAYKEMTEKAHKEGIKVYGGTITPIDKSFYHTDFREAARDSINNWIRTNSSFDAVIDFDEAIRNPQDSTSILPEAQSGDYLHPNELGYEMMGKAIDLSLFEE